MEDGKEEEWEDLMMSSKGLFSGFAPENCVSKSMDEIFYSGEGSFGCNDHEKGVENSSKFELERTMLKGCDNDLNSSIVVNNFGVVKTGVSIAERRAINCGFDASKIRTPRFRSSCLLPSPNGRCSPCITISPGISPQSLLDSPMLLPNSQLSPTTGTFASRLPDGDGKMLNSAAAMIVDKGTDGCSSVMFKPHADTMSLACFHAVDSQVSSTGGLAQSLVANSDSQPLNAVHAPLDFEFPVRFCKEVGIDSHEAGSPLDRKFSDDLNVNSNLSTYEPCDSTVACLQMPHENGHIVGDDSGTHDSLDKEQNGIYPLTGTVRTAEDGYNWRKYGQKQVKGSEYPRSYYKCTQPNCPVKKKVERSHDGQITEIIYKGAHNHPKPQPCRKSGVGSSSPFNETSDMGDGSGSCVSANGGSVWRNIQPGNKDALRSDWRIDGLERTSSASAVTEVSDPLSSTQGKPMGVLESAGTSEFSSTLASHEDDDEDAATQGSFLIGLHNENEPDLKRRKKDGSFAETTLGSRAVREPRVVVQIESEVDILDDGYRWRKYGQKVVKGNPNPRSYYKCTSSGCIVRKHVERSSLSKKFVITTYEGKHNHEVPAARNSSHATNQTALRNSHLPKPEPHSQDLPLHFDTKMECDNDFLRPNFLSNLGNGTPFYPMKFPTLPNTTQYGPFGLNTPHPAYGSSLVPAIPDLSFPLSLGFPHSVASYCNPERLHSAVPSLYAGERLKESDLKLVRPKQERRDDSLFETEINSMDHTDTSSSVYNNVMGNFQP